MRTDTVMEDGSYKISLKCDFKDCNSCREIWTDTKEEAEKILAKRDFDIDPYYCSRRCRKASWIDWNLIRSIPVGFNFIDSGYGHETRREIVYLGHLNVSSRCCRTGKIKVLDLTEENNFEVAEFLELKYRSRK